MELQEALAHFLLLDRARSTRDTYRKVLTRFVEDIGPGRPLEQIRPEDVNAYVLKLRDRGQKWATHPTRPQIDEPLSPATVYKHIKTIKRLFNWCVEVGYIEQSPARGLIARRPIQPLGEGKAATENEALAILSAATHNERDWAVMLLLTESGARASEIAGLKIRNLVLPENCAIVDGKGNKRRKIYFMNDTSDAIRAWLQVRPEVDHDFVFTSLRGGSRLQPQGISQIVRRLSKTAGLDRTLGAHAFRHYVGTKLAREHVALPIIQAWLGHSDPSITMQYQRSLDTKDIRSAGQILEIVKPTDQRIIDRFRRDGQTG